MDYKKNLIDLICGTDGQVDTYIKKVMREEWDVQNGNPPDRMKTPPDVYGTGRFGELQQVEPKHSSPRERGSSRLVADGDNPINNNPLYPSNMVDRLNTPFDHIERILLQDFSGANAMDIEGDNYFKSIFQFAFNTRDYGVTGFRMTSQGTSSNYDKVSNKFKQPANIDNGGFFIDSFTYTPFIEYSVGDPRVGIYSDEFLTDYNTGKYNQGSGTNSHQKDTHRRTLSSELYQLRNLEQDIYRAKMNFRQAIQNQDQAVYIYTFCQHLAKLFAKLSNIRMSHEIYGFKHPHVQWEGILALDIWYQMLYNEIDGAYPFDEGLLNMNPMVRKKIKTSGGNKYVEYDESGTNASKKLYQNNLGDGIQWIEDESAPGYAYIWDSNLWNRYNQKSADILAKRDECVTPRGVLKKIWNIVNEWSVGPKKAEIADMSDGDFPWFKQKGNVYHHADGFAYSKYPNLHLGRAYEVMTSKEYYELTGQGLSGDKYQKPVFTKGTSPDSVLKTMVEHGCEALDDAFQVMKDKKVFRIVNSANNNVIEDFQEANLANYSQGQCAVVIERVFSELYKYLQFKSTTSELFQRHININSGYKYLTTESLLGSDNDASDVYYSDSDAVGYLRYLAKLNEYANGTVNIGLTDNEKKLLGQFISIVEKEPVEWLDKNWDLCPLCRGVGQLPRNAEQMERVRTRLASAVGFSLKSRNMSARGVDDEDYEEEGDDEDVKRTRIVYVYLNTGAGVTLNATDLSIPSGYMLESSGGKPDYFLSTQEVYDHEFNIDLSQVTASILNNPRFTYEGTTIQYTLLGFSDDRFATTAKYKKDEVLYSDTFDPDQSVIALHAVWSKKAIVKFLPGSIPTTGTMANMVVDANKNTKLANCTFVPDNPAWNMKKFIYHNSTSTPKLWNDVEGLNPSQQTVNKYELSYWEYRIDGNVVRIEDGGYINVTLNPDDQPVVVLMANWREAWNSIGFEVEGQRYCDVLISAANPRLVHPVSPVMVDPNRTFIDWDRAEGSWLSGLEISGVPTVYEPSSGTVSNTRIICTDSPDIPIICLDDSMSEYGIKVNANIGVRETMNFGVMFKYLTDDGEYTDAYQNVAENTHIPSFHIHSTVIKNGKKMVFKYWELESGDLSSSMTILSPCVFVAVYEEVADQPSYAPQNKWNPDVLPDDEGTLTGAATFNGSSCPYISDLPDDGDESDEVCKQIDGINPTSRYYCKYLGRPPKQTDAQIADVDCPYIHLLLSGIDISQYDFASFTLLEIQDVADLIKVLFKVNIDIAHREYYLKIDIPEVSDWWYGYKEGSKWYSFEPTVEYKFSNFHAANQPENGKLLCTVTPDQATDSPTMWITPINRELKDDSGAVHYNDFWYYYDFKKSFEKEWRVNSDLESKVQQITRNIDETQRYYAIKPLYLYQNTKIQSPVDVNRFIRHRHGCIPREREYQLKTFMTIVKKYRPVIMPKVTDIFGQCNCATTKYQADSNNDYGVFGWCTIPSKTMINMEYNEQAIIVPSTYDHHNRIGGSNFLQMDSDFVIDGTRRCVYEKLSGSKDTGSLVDNTKNTWYYLYNTRDWTYFMQPFFNLKRNNEIFGSLRDTYRKALWPDSSDHLNGIIFERSNKGRVADTEFLDIALTCQFLAKYHHNENNLKILSERYTNLLDFNKLKELTIAAGDEFNSRYGSEYQNIPEDFAFPEQDWIDDYDKTSSYVDLTVNKYKPGATTPGALKYKYNLGQAHAIDDFDENSVWFYITMVEPIDDSEQVIELEDIMPFVFWWENRGRWNNGPTVDCYGHQGDAKMNYEKGGWCYSNAHQTYHENVVVNSAGYGYTPELAQEQCWHAVQHTLGTDFSKKEYGGTILTTDNSGNTYKGAFDPNCAATSEKWKIHHVGNAFGAPQHEDPVEDRYYLAYQAHGEGEFKGKLISDENNAKIMESLQDRPMTWNLWNCVRHYVFMKYFKNRSRNIESKSDWNELEQYTKKLVKGIYRTFMDQRYTNKALKTRTRFGDAFGGGSSSNSGNTCLVRWTNSFAEISSMLERNYREHQASFVLFTGNVPKDATEISTVQGTIRSKYGNVQNLAAMASGKYRYDHIANSHDNFVVETLNGVDSDIDGMRERERKNAGNPYAGYQSPDEKVRAITPKVRIYQGFKNVDIPSTYIIGDNLSYSQQLPQRIVDFHTLIDLDKEYPEAEYYLNDRSRKWVQRIRQAVMNRQIFPVYTSMETMTASVHDVTIDQLKSITFQVVPQFYWKYEWSYNEFMIHFVGRLESPSKDIVMYDMLGNVWEWVRDNWTANVSDLNPINPIFSDDSSSTKVIRGGAFDQYCRKTISSSREGLDWDQFQSQFGTQANVGFRPSMVFTADFMDSGFTAGTTPVDLFFLFDASMSTGPVVQQMVDSANAIAKMFAPEVSGNSPSAAEKEICHVGSALFLGPKIRLMCSNLMEGAVTEARQKDGSAAFGNGTYDISGDIYAVHFCQGPQRHSDGTYGWGWGAYSEPVGYNQQIEYGKADVLSLRGNYGPCGFIGDQRSFPDGIKTYFKNAFNKIRDAYQKSTESVMSSRSISGINDYRTMVDYDMEDFEEDEPLDIVEEKGFELEQEIKHESKMKAMDMMSRGSDAHGGNSGDTGEGNWGSYPYCIHNYEAVFEHMFVHRGVPIWNDISVGGQLHFETDGVYALEHPDSAVEECCLNTYNPSRDDEAKRRFENPFMQSRRGVLCNWWNGSEPVSHILAKLLGSGYFGGFPHTPPIGYVFRSPKIPKLVFVYTNEFDNSHTRTKTNNGENVLVMPGMTEGNDVRLYPAHGVATGLDGESLKGYFKTVKINGIEHKIRMGITTPPDPYCLQIVKEYINNENASRTQMSNWMNSMNLGSIFGTFTTYAGSICYPGSSWIKFKPMLKKVLSNEGNSEDYGYIYALNFNAAVGMVSLPANVDLLRRGKNGVFAKEKKTWSYIDSIMAADQMSCLRINGVFPGVDQGVSISDYKWALTQGFYEMHKVISEKTDPMNLYMFVTDANAPRPLTENSSAADAMCLALDDYWISEIKDKTVPGTSYNWKQAAYANLLYWQQQDGDWNSEVDKNAQLTGTIDQMKTNAKRIYNVLGMDNPYTNTKIVWGIRDWDGDQPVWSAATKVYGFPIGYGKSSKRKMANLFKDKTESVCVSKGLNPICNAVEWRSNKNNVRMKLTASNADLVFVDWGAPSNGKARETDIHYAPIDRLVSPESIRYDQVGFNCYAWGCYRNSYAFSPEFTIDDAVTISFKDHGGGCIKILCWNSLAVVSPPMKDLNGKGKQWEEKPPAPCGNEIDWEGGAYKYGSKFGLPSIVYRGNSLGAGYSSHGPYIRRGYGNNFFQTTKFVPAGNSKIPVGSGAWKIFYNLMDTSSTVYKKAGEVASLGAYPSSFKNVIAKLAAKSILKVTMEKDDKKVPGKTMTNNDWKKLWGSSDGASLRTAAMNQYIYLKNVLPYAMAYRFHRDIFSRLVNGLGNPVTDYDNDENVVIFKALPVTDFTRLKDVFETSFQQGLFNSSSSFQYSHCIVDLNPDPDLYGEVGYRPASGSFPLVFANDIEVNTDEYKKSKIVFQRIEPISGTKHDSLQMGERVGYYGKVTDPDRIKYSDDESIKTASTDNFKNITLGNGGSYQKKHPEIDPQTRKTSTWTDDLYNVPLDPSNPRKKKYSPNRHFFMDPFQLTVAQWCHAHEKHTKHAAIQFIAGGTSSSTFTTAGKAQLNEMAKSFWKYLMVWEHDLFASYKSGNSRYKDGSDQDYLEALYGDADSMCNSYSTSGNYAYDPLNDMRPYYYAKYSEVRGTKQVYAGVPNGVDEAGWKKYLIDSNKGDEFQMNKRTGGTSFMDILNSKVVMQGRKREYMVDVEGAERLNLEAMNRQSDAEKEKRWWRSGKEVGLNFDLPTEAQWEYCCRAGSTSAFPTKYNLGINFEEADSNLDVIAWYKYKVIGALPEPERFCAWRISKLLFGITKDKEMINNVYETTPD